MLFGCGLLAALVSIPPAMVDVWYREPLEAGLSRIFGLDVTVGEISGSWTSPLEARSIRIGIDPSGPALVEIDRAALDTGLLGMFGGGSAPSLRVSGVVVQTGRGAVAGLERIADSLRAWAGASAENREFQELGRIRVQLDRVRFERDGEILPFALSGEIRCESLDAGDPIAAGLEVEQGDRMRGRLSATLEGWTTPRLLLRANGAANDLDLLDLAAWLPGGRIPPGSVDVLAFDAALLAGGFQIEATASGGTLEIPCAEVPVAFAGWEAGILGRGRDGMLEEAELTVRSRECDVAVRLSEPLFFDGSRSSLALDLRAGASGDRFLGAILNGWLPGGFSAPASASVAGKAKVRVGVGGSGGGGLDDLEADLAVAAENFSAAGLGVGSLSVRVVVSGGVLALSDGLAGAGGSLIRLHGTIPMAHPWEGSRGAIHLATPCHLGTGALGRADVMGRVSMETDGGLLEADLDLEILNPSLPSMRLPAFSGGSVALRGRAIFDPSSSSLSSSGLSLRSGGVEGAVSMLRIDGASSPPSLFIQGRGEFLDACSLDPGLSAVEAELDGPWSVEGFVLLPLDGRTASPAECRIAVEGARGRVAGTAAEDLRLTVEGSGGEMALRGGAKAAGGQALLAGRRSAGSTGEWKATLDRFPLAFAVPDSEIRVRGVATGEVQRKRGDGGDRLLWRGSCETLQIGAGGEAVAGLSGFAEVLLAADGGMRLRSADLESPSVRLRWAAAGSPGEPEGIDFACEGPGSFAAMFLPKPVSGDLALAGPVAVAAQWGGDPEEGEFRLRARDGRLRGAAFDLLDVRGRFSGPLYVLEAVEWIAGDGRLEMEGSMPWPPASRRSGEHAARFVASRFPLRLERSLRSPGAGSPLVLLDRGLFSGEVRLSAGGDACRFDAEGEWEDLLRMRFEGGPALVASADRIRGSVRGAWDLQSGSLSLRELDLRGDGFEARGADVEFSGRGIRAKSLLLSGDGAWMDSLLWEWPERPLALGGGVRLSLGQAGGGNPASWALDAERLLLHGVPMEDVTLRGILDGSKAVVQEGRGRIGRFSLDLAAGSLVDGDGRFDAKLAVRGPSGRAPEGAGDASPFHYGLVHPMLHGAAVESNGDLVAALEIAGSLWRPESYEGLFHLEHPGVAAHPLPLLAGLAKELPGLLADRLDRGQAELWQPLPGVFERMSRQGLRFAPFRATLRIRGGEIFPDRPVELVSEAGSFRSTEWLVAGRPAGLRVSTDVQERLRLATPVGRIPIEPIEVSVFTRAPVLPGGEPLWIQGGVER